MALRIRKDCNGLDCRKGYHTGNIMNAFRLTLVGEGKGPHMFDISWVLGKEETLARMKRAIEVLS